MPRYFIAYRKTEEAGQKPEWASFTTESETALEAHGVRERVDKRLSVFGEKLAGSGEVRWLGSSRLVEFLVKREESPPDATMSLADISAAAHLSVADYLGGIDWVGHEQTRRWYAGFKSRPSFRPLLSERMEVIAPPPHYEKPDF